jgi:hypothetical protein
LTPIQTAEQTNLRVVREEGRGSEPEVDQEPSSSSATWEPPDQHGRSVNNYSGGAVGLNTNAFPDVSNGTIRRQHLVRWRWRESVYL